jgi:serine/threonine-protein kinase
MVVKLPFKFPDRYSFEGERLEGGQGYVYICSDLFLERKVAVKVVSTPADMTALRQELALLADIRSAHVAEIYDLLEAQSGKHIGLVEQFVGGNHLADLVGKCKIIQFMRTMYQLCCGLSDIHAVQKIHRDIKPNNIRFDEEGILKILDFGISCNVEGEGKTLNGKGTHPYIAPELYDLPANYTNAVDIYAAGVLAYELAFGQLEACLKSIPPQKMGNPKKFSTSPLNIAPEICDLLDGALNPSPAKRPKVEDLKRAFERRLAFGRHRAAVTSGAQSWILSDSYQSLTLKSLDCVLTIAYDGLRFIVTSATGNVDVNNIKVKVGEELPASCVVAMNTENGSRSFITIDMSNPNIIL